MKLRSVKFKKNIHNMTGEEAYDASEVLRNLAMIYKCHFKRDFDIQHDVLPVWMAKY